jgi:hypothetical protein
MRLCIYNCHNIIALCVSKWISSYYIIENSWLTYVYMGLWFYPQSYKWMCRNGRSGVPRLSGSFYQPQYMWMKLTTAYFVWWTTLLSLSFYIYARTYLYAFLWYVIICIMACIRLKQWLRSINAACGTYVTTLVCIYYMKTLYSY